MKILRWTMYLAGWWITTFPVAAQLGGWTNHGLVAVGRVPADAFDARGPALDTLGGFGSAAFFDVRTWSRNGDSYSGVLYALPDRGFGDGTQNYLPRIQVFHCTVTPFTGVGPAPQTQISLVNTQTLLLSYDGTNFFTGFDADDASITTHPQSSRLSLGGGRRSLDPEGLVRLADGRFYISDEYGPFIYRFSAAGELEMTFEIPASLLPKKGPAYPRTNSFTGATAPDSGRRNNRGLEGLSLSPDGKRLFAMLQSPTMQDAGGGTSGRNTRLLVFDADESSPTYGQPLAQYVYELTLRGSAATNRHTPVSEIVALNRTELLVLERDQIGQGIADTNLAPTYKRVVLASVTGASNILHTAYDLERDAPGQKSLPASGLPPDVRPMQRVDFVDLLDPVSLAKFGLNASTPHNTNTIPEKLEALTLIPLNDPTAPHDFLLLVLSDNDFKAPVVYHNGLPVGTNQPAMDTLAFAYRVTLPTYGAPPPANQVPSVRLIGPTNQVLAVPVTLTVVAQAYDQDGRIVQAELRQGTTVHAVDLTYPFEWTLTLTNPGTFTLQAWVRDNEGATAGSEPYTVSLVASNKPPLVSLIQPASGSVWSAPAEFSLEAEASDEDGWVERVVFYQNGRPVGTNASRPFVWSIRQPLLGTHVFTAVAVDNHGLSHTSAPVPISVVRNASSPLFTLQLLHASDFEAGLGALEDAPAFSSVLAALAAAYPDQTLIVSSGDNYIPGPFFSAGADPAAGFNGVGARADIAMLNAMGFQASALGNHEFDAGTAHVRSVLLADPAVGYPGTRFPYLSANLNFALDGSFAGLTAAEGQDARLLTNRVTASCIVSVAGQPIGLVGVTTPDLRAISSPGNVGVDTNVVEAVQAAVDRLLARGVNKIILLAHLQQFHQEFALAPRLRDVDVIVAGGSHAIFAKPTDRLRAGDVAVTNYPVWFTSAVGEPVAVVNTGPNYRYVGRLIVEFDPAGRITGVNPASGAYATDPQGVLETGNVPPNPQVVQIVTNVGAILRAKDGHRFGRTTVYLNGLRSVVRTEESNLGNLTADANLWWAQQMDPTVSLSLKNGGGIRDSIGAFLGAGGGAALVPPLPNPAVGKQWGDISQLDIENALRFNNGLTLLTLTARQLRDVIEWSVAATAPGATPGQFPQVSGLWFSYDPARPGMTYRRSGGTIVGIDQPGSRVRTLVAARPDGTLDLVVENGELVGDPNRTFRMVTLGFLANGGDNYYPLTLAAGRLDLAPASGNSFFTAGSEQWALASYLTNIQVFTQPDLPAHLDQRIQNLALRPDTVAWPRIVNIRITAQEVELRIAAVPNYAYQVQASTNLVDWETLGWVSAADQGYLRFVDRLRSGSNMRYYRIVRAVVPAVRMAILSDPHFMDPSLLVNDGPAFQSYLARDRKLLRESPAILEAAIDGILQASPQIVLIAGDLTKDGERVSHQGLTNALQRLRTAGISVFVCPGNHDVANPHALRFDGSATMPVPSVSPSEFAALYHHYGYGQAVARDPNSLSYVVEPVPGLWILSMDAARYDRNTNGYPYTGGYFDPLRWQWITNQLAAAQAQGKFVIGMVHHNVLEHFPGQKGLFPDYVLDNFETVQAEWARFGLRIVFTGHFHAQDIARVEHPAGTLFDVQTGSLVTYPSPYRMVTLSTNGVLSVETRYVETIAWDLGGEPFPTYAHRFLTNGLMGIVVNTLTQPPYNLPRATAEFLAPAMTEAFTSHYQGDEGTRPISPYSQAVLTFLQGQTDPVSQLFASTLHGLFHDPPPADRYVRLDLMRGAAQP
ncbi:MAG: esterase-like activity of phytase family protein [Verrucomicrobiota bacterium]|nr:esterase-like activity of phytase family protein [Limisphaera sp.]MDW8381413.1 esterase-like activity of phytase family protein [Verrucomicrobiota bacterium]